MTFDEGGDGWQPNSRPGVPPHRWPREGLLGSGRIDDVEVRCITPDLQLRWHVYAKLDDVDWQDVQRLSDRFGLGVPEELRERPGFVSPKRAQSQLN